MTEAPFKTARLALAAAAVAAATLGALPAHAAGDAVAGEKKAAMCIGCHGIPGYRASFPEVYQVPMIAGQNAAYIASALTAYKKGDRRHPTMRGIAEGLSEQDMADLGAFYEAQAKGHVQAAPESVPAAPADVAALLTKGACASCHGANFSKPIDPSYPKIAGQHADYLYSAVRAYQVENKPVFGRVHAIMGPQMRPFKHSELKALSRYLASLPGELATVRQSPFR